MSSSLPAAERARLEAAYCATTYRIHAPQGDIDLRIYRHTGEISAGLATLLADAGASCWAIITAWNPQSRPQDEASNAAAQAELRRQLELRGCRWLLGENIADDGAWLPEPTFFVVSLAAEAARALGRDFGQHAVVSGSAGDVPKLQWCAEAPHPFG